MSKLRARDGVGHVRRRRVKLVLSPEDAPRALAAFGSLSDVELLESSADDELLLNTSLELREIHRVLYAAEVVPGAVEESAASLEELFRAVEMGAHE